MRGRRRVVWGREAMGKQAGKHACRHGTPNATGAKRGKTCISQVTVFLFGKYTLYYLFKPIKKKLIKCKPQGIGKHIGRFSTEYRTTKFQVTAPSNQNSEQHKEI